MKKFIQKKLISNGIFLEFATSKEKIRSLIKSLRSYNIGKDLIRLGPNGDGGYLVPNDLEGIEACFSPGVNEISGFEEDCFKIGMKLFLADKSVDGPAQTLNSAKFQFIKKFVGSSTKGDFITLEYWVNSSKLSSQSDLLLQMDIEGSEYLTILSTPDSLLNRFRIIVIEFHHLEKLWNREYYRFVSATFEKILQNHTCVHIHPNNARGIYVANGIEIPHTMEFTFIRNDRISHKIPQTAFPHSLDFDNAKKPHVSLPKIWYENPINN